MAGSTIYKGEEAFVSGKYLVENKPIEIVEKDRIKGYCTN